MATATLAGCNYNNSIIEVPTTAESITEESATSKVEIETSSPDKDPFTSEVAGSYTDEDYEFTDIEELPEEVALDMYEKLIADGLIGGVVVTKPAEQPTTAPNISNKITRYNYFHKRTLHKELFSIK